MVNMDLADYVKRARQAGMEEIKIRDELVAKGWNIIDVESAFNYRSAPPQPIQDKFSPPIKPEEKKPRIKYPSPSKSVAFVVVFGGSLLGYFLIAYFYTTFYNLPMWPFGARIEQVVK